MVFRVTCDAVAPATKEVGLSVAVIPLGAPLRDRATAPVKPPVLVSVTEELAFCPATMLMEAGLAASEMEGTAAAVTDRLTV